jgi:ribose transport system permease protein
MSEIADSSVARRLTSQARRLYRAAPALILVLLVVAIGLANPVVISVDTLIIVLADTAVLFVLAAGVTFVIMLGGIDLSIQAVGSLASVVIAEIIGVLGFWSLPIAVLVGTVCGLISGVVHVYLRIPSFIATLATSGVYIAAALVISGSRAVTLSETDRAVVEWIHGTTLGIPSVIFLGAAVAIVSMLIQRYTVFGRYSKAIGAGEQAALASGVRVNRHKIIAFALSGTFAAFAGVILTARMSSGSPELANQLLLPAIAAVIVGGTAITGGVGSVGRTLVGALIVSLVRIGMTFVGVDVFAQQIVFGVVLILAVAVTIDRSKIPIVK